MKTQTSSLNKLLDFVRFTHEIRNIERTIHFERDDIQENDMEHQYQLALLALFIIENDKLELDKNKCVSLALIHDIVEVYAGDVSVHLPGYNDPNRSKNEKQAAEKIKKQWPTFKSYAKLVDEYEARKTPEAIFVYALDKLIPILNIYLYEGRSWHIMDIDLEKMKEVKVGKVDVSPDINEYYKEFLKVLEQKPGLFGSPKKMIKLAGCIIKDKEEKILLLHRNDGRYKHWEIPGGKIEPGESPTAAAAREIKEELAVEVEIQQKLGKKEFIDRGRQLHYTWFLAEITDGKPKVAELRTFDELSYFSLEEMRKMSSDLSLGAQNYLSIIKK